MVKIGIIGSTGYAGVELVRILLNHPESEITAIGSQSFEGKELGDVYPAMNKLCGLKCIPNEDVIDKSDVVFACLPHGLSQDIAAKCINAGKIFIDLGADFRLQNEAEYKTWYDGVFDDPNLHSQAVYALPELFREDIKGKRLIANPGCYPTAVTLALFPVLKRGLIEADSIVIDAKSGVTGAGRSLSQNTHFPDCNESFAPYKIAAHRHTPEIEQNLIRASGKRLRVTFVPHLLPVNRGILSTAYARIPLGVTEEKLRSAYEDFYSDEKFIRLLEPGKFANIRDVKYTNYCDISIHTDKRTGMFIVVSAIDNMVKGASGQAVQNMNIVCGFPENTALTQIPPSF